MTAEHKRVLLLYALFLGIAFVTAAVEFYYR